MSNRYVEEERAWPAPFNFCDPELRVSVLGLILQGSTQYPSGKHGLACLICDLQWGRMQPDSWPTDRITGFVLAGGKSRRMGTDKAAVPLNGRPLINHALTTLRSLTKDVLILGSSQIYANHGAEVVEDIFPGCGPLSGIHAALSHTKTRFNLIIAVDTPFLSSDLLAFIVGRALSSGAMVTTPEIAGYSQPLCSVYSLDFLPMAEHALKNGTYKIVPLFPGEQTLVIREEELAKFAFTPEMFDNLNTPDDLERARQRVGRKKP